MRIALLAVLVPTLAGCASAEDVEWRAHLKQAYQNALAQCQTEPDRAFECRHAASVNYQAAVSGPALESRPTVILIER